MTNFNLQDEVVELLKDHRDFTDKGNGRFEYTIYSDTYELDQSWLEEIFDDDKPLYKFNEIIQNDIYSYDDIFKIADELTDKLTDELDSKVDYQDVLDILYDIVDIDFGEYHYIKNQTVYFDIFMANDGYAYEDNLVEFAEDSDEIVSVSPYFEKFIKTQGYTGKAFIEYYNSKKKGKKFFDSLVAEIDELYEKWGEIVFLGSAPLEAICKEMTKGEGTGIITIPKTAVCGIFQSETGSGSLFDIELEKPIKGKIGKDFDVRLSDGYNYSVDEVYGFGDSVYDETEIL